MINRQPSARWRLSVANGALNNLTPGADGRSSPPLTNQRHLRLLMSSFHIYFIVKLRSFFTDTEPLGEIVQTDMFWEINIVPGKQFRH